VVAVDAGQVERAPSLNCKRDREGIDFFYRDCGTPEELAFYLKRWTKKQCHPYSMGYRLPRKHQPAPPRPTHYLAR
jgi:hypothetical protein